MITTQLYLLCANRAQCEPIIHHYDSKYVSFGELKTTMSNVRKEICVEKYKL